MTVESLLGELAEKTQGARLQRMYALGQDPQAQPVLAELMRSESVYARLLALASCWGSRETTFAELARRDSSRVVRARALSVLALWGTPDAALSVVQELPSRQARRTFIVKLARARRTEALDLVLSSLGQSNDPDFARFLAYGSPEVVAAGLAREGIAFRTTEVAALARRHPELLVRVLIARAQALTGRDPLFLELCRSALHFLPERDPDAALALLRALLTRFSLVEITLSETLARRRPQAIAELILSGDTPIWISLRAIGKDLDTERLVALARQHPDPNSVQGAFPALSPEKRRVLYTACGLGWRLANGALSLTVVKHLPDAALRHAEARRHWDLPALVTKPAARLPFAALLPWDEARVAVEPYLKNPEAELRSLALRALCTAAGYSADAIPELLRLLKAREFEQDPIRLAMLTGLAELPPGRWQAEHLDDLSMILAHARNAADLSLATGAQAAQLVGRLLKRFPEWAAPELALWVKAQGQLNLTPLQHGLSAAELARLEPHLLPILRSWKTRERESYLLSAASVFGKHLATLPGVVHLLEKVIEDTAHHYTAARALVLLALHARVRFATLVPELLSKDPSWITQTPVWEHLHRQRQDLLTEAFLGRRAFKGRFSTGRARFLLPVTSHFDRWTPGQQQHFAESLTELLADSERPNYESFQAVKQYAALIEVPWEPLLRLARLEMRNPALRDTALRALARLDGGQGTEVLVEALGDTRMRIAIYALRESVLELPLTQALALLRDAPRQRVTVAKEVLRLLGDLPSAAGLDDVLTWSTEPNLHRDVQVARIRALWPHREQARVWPVLEQALASGDAPLAAVALRAPLDGLSPQALHRQVGLMVQGLRHADPSPRLMALDAALTVPNNEGLLTEPVLARLDSPFPDERAIACRVLVQTLCADTPELAGAAVRRVLPNRRALVGVVQALHSAVGQGRTRWERVARAALEALATDPLTLALQARLAVAALSEEALTAWLKQAALADEAQAAAIVALEQRAAQQALPTLASALLAATEPGHRRLSLAVLVGQSRGSDGWTEAALATLAQLHQDPNPLVAAAAQFTFPPEAR